VCVRACARARVCVYVYEERERVIFFPFDIFKRIKTRIQRT
jgi:hypothetical protein